MQLRAERQVIDLLCQERQTIPDGAGPLPRFAWTSARSDANDEWDHLTIDVLGLPKANKCATHLGIIGFRNGTHAKYIADIAFREDTEDGFWPMIRMIADITNINLAVIAQDKFVEHLVEINKRTAADWQRGEWTGENGRYPLACSCGPGARCVM
jgi:hypothetical protein